MAENNLKNQQGQVIVLVLLMIVIILAVGLSLIGRSSTEVSSSRKIEDSARAFSAAEAGVERAIAEDAVAPIAVTEQANKSYYDVDAKELPASTLALRHPDIDKKSFAQFWLADPDVDPPTLFYNQPSFDLYFGSIKDYTSNPADQPGVEVHVVVRKASDGSYYDKRYYYDSNTSRTTSNGFNRCVNSPPSSVAGPIPVNSSVDESFYCQVHVPPLPITDPYIMAAGDYPVMARVRILYSNTAHPVALQPTNGGSLPLQAKIYTATGTSGQAQRKIEVFRQKQVMPFAFDFVLYAQGDLTK